MEYTVYCKLREGSYIAALGMEIVNEVAIRNLKAESEKIARFSVEAHFPQFQVVRVEERKEKTSSKIHIEFLRQRYGKKAEAWKGCPDDRGVFSNIYFMLIEAYEAVDGIEAPYVVTSLNRTCREERQKLDRIAKVFEGREGGEPIA